MGDGGWGIRVSVQCLSCWLGMGYPFPTLEWDDKVGFAVPNLVIVTIIYKVAPVGSA